MCSFHESFHSTRARQVTPSPSVVVGHGDPKDYGPLPAGAVPAVSRPGGTGIAGRSLECGRFVVSLPAIGRGCAFDQL